MSEGLGVQGYRTKLAEFVAELIAASGKTADAQECAAKLAAEHGFNGLFDQHDMLRVDVITAALAKHLPEEAPEPAHPGNYYGYGRELFEQLSPLERIKAIDKYTWDQSVAAKREADAKADAIARANRPAHWDEMSPEHKLQHWYAQQQKAKDARAA